MSSSDRPASPALTAHPDALFRFHETARRRPAHVAVEAPEGAFTYGELERLACRLGHRLRAMGVGRDTTVGVSLRRGAGELVTLLAVLEAGGAYVPLDPTHPIDRLAAILEDAAPRVLVTSPDSPLRTMSFAGDVLVLDELAGATAGQPETPLEVTVDPAQLNYVLFTSGSTGKPKGVEITRGAFANFLGSMIHTPGLSEDDRLLAITTTSFDIAGLELFLPLAVGATVVIADAETARDPRLLRRKLEGERITLMQATPATWRMLLEAGWRGDGKLRMLCGGEALSPALADRLLAAGGELWNMYGPTETTVWSTLERIHPGYDRITVGRPIDATQLYVLDEALRPVSVGAEGEIFIGGLGLARGYRGRPELTAERFVQNPLGPPGDRIYHTGDLGRFREDGRLECLGRLDHQVKIRGFRIELGEIETVLRGAGGVSEVLVVAEARAEGDPRLVAYWVGAAAREALIAEARRKLPAYMVPAAYVNLPSFPLNTNGKIDRKRLPAPDAEPIAAGGALLRPRDDAEARVAAIWCDVLGVPEVPVDGNFFTIGGTSLLAARVVARLQEETGVEVPLRLLFESPTIEGLAKRLGERASSRDPIVVWLRRGTPGAAPLFCIFGVQLYGELALALPPGRPVVAMHVPFLHVPGRDPRPPLEEIARRYAELVRAHQPHGPYDLLGLCFGGIVAWEVAAQLEQAGEVVASVSILDAILPTAVRVDRWGRLRDWARRAIHPRELRRFLERRARRRAARDGGHAGPVDIPVDGPEVDAEVARFAAGARALAARVLVVRATAERVPPWMSVAGDQGWGGRARAVTVHDIGATHLEILREPHVRSLARAVGSLIAPGPLSAEAPVDAA